MKKKIKCWKAASEHEMTLHEALNVLRSLDSLTYPRAGIGHDQYNVMEMDECREKNFSMGEVLAKSWKVYIPDTNAEEMLAKCRQIIKDEHFTGLKFDKIDNMTISELFSYICYNTLSNTSDNVKYRLIKKIIEDKLYKE